MLSSKPYINEALRNNTEYAKSIIALSGFQEETYVKKAQLTSDFSLKEGAKAYSSPETMKEVVSKAGISNFRILDDPAGCWEENKEVGIEMANRGYDSFRIIHVNAYLDNSLIQPTQKAVRLKCDIEMRDQIM